MRILLVDRDERELAGIRWFLQVYGIGNIEAMLCTTIQHMMTSIVQEQPDALLLNIDVLPKDFESRLTILLQQQGIYLLAMTDEPVYQQALRAIDLQACTFFTKPVDLEKLKKKLFSLQKIERPVLNTESFYRQMFSEDVYIEDAFVLIEPEERAALTSLCTWLEQAIIFSHMQVYPLSTKVVCIVPHLSVTQDMKVLQQEWQHRGKGALNICLYDSERALLHQQYEQTKKALEQCFYKGFGHIFYTSQQQQPLSFDPLLSPSQQQHIINSLQLGDFSKFREVLQPLQQQMFEQEDVRVHLTSILAQVRRFMLQHHLEQQQELEGNYRQLFRFIVEHAILYAIITEVLYFTQSVLQAAKQQHLHSDSHFVQEAVAFIDKFYRDSDMTLTTVAAQIGISSNYLSTLFTKEVGIPFKRYVQQYRIDKAAEQLQQTTEAITEIAFNHGFADPNYFSKVFKQQTGISPGKYRKYKNSTYEPLE